VLRTNVSTRPFYNERAVHVVIGVVAGLVLLATLINVVWVVSLSARNTLLGTQIRQDEQTAAKLDAEAKSLRSRINQQELAVVVTAAREANALIDQRTFSWTEFFNLIEATLPADVMLMSVSPTVTDGETEVRMKVLARRAEDIDAFMESLEGTKAFSGLLPISEQLNEAGLHDVELVGRYVAPVTEAAR
jgi:hypothetical protein